MLTCMTSFLFVTHNWNGLHSISQFTQVQLEKDFLELAELRQKPSYSCCVEMFLIKPWLVFDLHESLPLIHLTATHKEKTWNRSSADAYSIVCNRQIIIVQAMKKLTSVEAECNRNARCWFVFLGTAPVCDPRNVSACLTPEFDFFMANNLVSSCQCPNQCSKLTYNYVISQAVASQHTVQWIRSAIQPNASEEMILKNLASLEV